jgi:nitrate reductase gamma subunit
MKPKFNRLFGFSSAARALQFSNSGAPAAQAVVLFRNWRREKQEVIFISQDLSGLVHRFQALFDSHCALKRTLFTPFPCATLLGKWTPLDG